MQPKVSNATLGKVFFSTWINWHPFSINSLCKRYESENHSILSSMLWEKSNHNIPMLFTKLLQILRRWYYQHSSFTPNLKEKERGKILRISLLKKINKYKIYSKAVILLHSPTLMRKRPTNIWVLILSHCLIFKMITLVTISLENSLLFFSATHLFSIPFTLSFVFFFRIQHFLYMQFCFLFTIFNLHINVFLQLHNTFQRVDPSSTIVSFKVCCLE